MNMVTVFKWMRRVMVEIIMVVVHIMEARIKNSIVIFTTEKGVSDTTVDSSMT